MLQMRAFPLATALLLTVLLAAGPPPAKTSGSPVLPVRVKMVLDTIKAGSLKGNLSFLASNALEGRYTPSPGLDVAAEFIASRFRAAGLEPGGDQDYFQTATMVDRRFGKPASEMILETGPATVAVPPASIQVYAGSEAASIQHAPALVFASPDIEALKRADVAGKVVITLSPDIEKLPPQQAMAEYRKMRAFNRAVGATKAAAEIVASVSDSAVPDSKLITVEQAERREMPILISSSKKLAEWVAAPPKSSGRDTFVSVSIPAPDDRRAVLKNVVGILRGSDSNLKNTCVMLTAHYDHIGTRQTGKSLAPPPKPSESADQIYNGANDDGSGTVSVIEIAQALARLHVRPKRSIVFMTFFGEERGELGSKYYGEHPVFPFSRTVADINLEQVGRTDSNTGKQVNTASLTGYDYSDVTKYLETAGRLTGIRVYKDNEASDEYFTRSDNDALAQEGVPAHSLTVAFEYPDYHGLGDEWPKIDYENMARVDRMIALGLLNMADAVRGPQWNAANAKTAPFREAQAKSLQNDLSK